MQILSFILALLLAASAGFTARGADLTKIDRTLAKEPTYRAKPRYCLLVFGLQANSRIWLIQDDDRLYVDRNGNGDLTEKGEHLATVKYLDGSCKWTVGDIVEADGTTRHAGLQVSFRRDSYLLQLRQTADGLLQEVGNELGNLRFSDSPKNAPVVHFAGPLTFLLQTPPRLIPGKEAHFIAMIGTPGLGEGAAAYAHIEDFGKLKMVVEVELPKQASDVPLRTRRDFTEY